MALQFELLTLSSPPWRQLGGKFGVRIQELNWFTPSSTTTAQCDLVQVTPILVLSFPICKTFTCFSTPFFHGGGLIDFVYPFTSTIMVF